MPLCTRCTGTYVGILGAMAAHLMPLRLVPSVRLAGLCVGVVLLGGLEVLAERFGWPGSNAARFASGLVMGAGVGTLLGVGLRTLLRTPGRRRHSAGGRPEG